MRKLTCITLSLALLSCAPRALQSGATSVWQSHRGGESFYVKRANQGLVIVFVHGIFGNSVDSWTLPNGTYFPLLLANDPAFDRADIYAYSYPSRFSSTFSISDVAQLMYERLTADQVLSRYVVFVCHSMGGLVVKKLLLNHRELSMQVPLMFLYSTPSEGAEVANLGRLVSSNEQLRDMLSGDFNHFLSDMQYAWSNANFNIRIECAIEMRSIHGIKVVDHWSGASGCHHVTPLDRDHNTIAKPESTASDSYIVFANAWAILNKVVLSECRVSPNDPTVLQSKLGASCPVPAPVGFPCSCPLLDSHGGLIRLMPGTTFAPSDNFWTAVSKGNPFAVRALSPQRPPG